MTILNKEMDGLKYSFVPYDGLEEWETTALNLSKDNVFKKYFENALATVINDGTYVDKFFINSTDVIVDRVYFIDENNKLNVKYLLLNDSLEDPLVVCLIKDLSKENQTNFENKFKEKKTTLD